MNLLNGSWYYPNYFNSIVLLLVIMITICVEGTIILFVLDKKGAKAAWIIGAIIVSNFITGIIGYLMRMLL